MDNSVRANELRSQATPQTGIYSGSFHIPTIDEINEVYKIQHEYLISNKNHYLMPLRKKDLLNKIECRICFKWLTKGYMPRHLASIHNMEVIKEPPVELTAKDCENGVPPIITVRTLKD